MDVGGQDATEAFEDVGHSDEAREILDKLLVGDLKRVVRSLPNQDQSISSSLSLAPEHPSHTATSIPPMHLHKGKFFTISFSHSLLPPLASPLNNSNPKADFHNFFVVIGRGPRPQIRTPQTHRRHHHTRQHRLRHRHLRSRPPWRRPRLRSLQIPATAKHGTEMTRSRDALRHTIRFSTKGGPFANGVG